MDETRHSKTVLIIGGATGGHLSPALALGHELKYSHHCRVIMILNPRAEKLKEHIPAYDFTYVTMPGIRHRFNPAELARAVRGALKIISFYKPDLIVGFGSAVSLPVIIAGWLRRVPRALHEQNAFFGLANNAGRLFCGTVGLSFPIASVRDSKKYFVCGNLLRPELVRYLRQLPPYEERVRPGHTRLLVIGGSQGAHAVNQTVVQTFRHMPEQERACFSAYHMVGPGENCEVFDQEYRALGIEHCVRQFHPDIGQIYAVSDLVISRAGAGSISEITAFGLPAILVPYPYARKHQKANAECLERHHAAVCIDQRDFTPARAAALLMELHHDFDKRVAMHTAALSLAHPYSSRIFAARVAETLLR